MQGNFLNKNQNSINKIINNEIFDADLSSVCQLIKHYRVITGNNYKISFHSSLTNYYSQNKINSVVYNNNSFLISLNQPVLLGVLGTLPRMLNNPIQNDYHSGIVASAEFIKIFESRYLELLLSANNKYNLLRQFEEESFPKIQSSNLKITDYLGNFLGLDSVSDYKHVTKQSLIRYSAILGFKQKNIGILLKLLNGYFNLNFSASYSFVQMKKLSKNVISKIGKSEQNNCLGRNIQLGDRVPMHGNDLVIKILLKSEREYKRITTDHNIFYAIHELITYYIGDRNVYRLILLVNSKYLSLPCLSSKQKKSRLGINICLRSDQDHFVEMPIKI